MAVQWLKLLPSNTGGEGSIPDWGAGPPPPPTTCLAAKKPKQKQYFNK